VDDGIKRIRRRKVPTNATDVDLPEMSRAVVCAIRRQASVSLDNRKDARFVRISGRGFDTVFTQGDWAQILGVIQAETFSPQLFPVESGVRSFDARVRLSSSTVDVNDPLYIRVLGVLQGLFTTKVPT
jgi:hypothetical protein